MFKEIIDTKVGKREIAIFWLGQNSFIFKTPKEKLIAIDPYFSRNNPRQKFIYPKPPVKPEDVKVDYVFCTHDHLDHTDPDTLPLIAKSSTKTIFFGPIESYQHFLKMNIPKNRAIAVEAGKSIKLDDFTVTPLYSVPPGEKITYQGKIYEFITHLGYFFDFKYIKIYNMGDSSPSVVKNPHPILDRVAELKPDIAIFPIYGDFPGRTPADALKFAKIVKPKIVIPSHYGCFSTKTIDPMIFLRLFNNIKGIKPVLINYAGKYVYRK